MGVGIGESAFHGAACIGFFGSNDRGNSSLNRLKLDRLCWSRHNVGARIVGANFRRSGAPGSRCSGQLAAGTRRLDLSPILW